jgi:hypothetical protein
MYVCSLRFLAYDCNLVHMINTFLNHMPFYHGSALSLYAHTRLVLTFFIMSRWTTLDLRWQMWKHVLQTRFRVSFNAYVQPSV